MSENKRPMIDRIRERMKKKEKVTDQGSIQTSQEELDRRYNEIMKSQNEQLNRQINEEMKQLEKTEKRLNDLNNSEGSRILMDTAKQAMEEILEEQSVERKNVENKEDKNKATRIKKFQDEYSDIEELIKCIRDRQRLEKQGGNYDMSRAPEIMKKYLVLEKSRFMTEEFQKSFIWPYLIEKNALGIETEDNKKDLESLLARYPNKLEFIKNLDRALVFYAALGLVGQKDGLMTKYTNFTRGNVSLPNYGIIEQGAEIAKELGLPYKQRNDYIPKQTQEDPNEEEPTREELTQEFEENYKETIDLAKAIRSKRWIESQGQTYDESRAPEIMQKYLKLEKSQFMTDKQRKFFLFPYFIERSSTVGLNSKEDITEFNQLHPLIESADEFSRNKNEIMCLYSALGLFNKEDVANKKFYRAIHLGKNRLQENEILERGSKIAKEVGLSNSSIDVGDSHDDEER